MKRTLLTALLLVALLAVGATPFPESVWQELYVNQLQGYRAERDRADALQAAVTVQETTIAELSAQNEELRASVEPLREQVDRLREYERYAGLERDVEGLRRTKSRLIDEIAPMQTAYSEARADLRDAYDDNTKLAEILAKYGTSGVWLNRIMCCGSMEPAISAADVMLMMNAPAAPIAHGEIIYFTCDGMPGIIAHRLNTRQLIDGQWFYTAKGDANPSPDPCLILHDDVPWITPADSIIKGVWK